MNLASSLRLSAAAALPTDRPIRNARVPQAIGQSFDWLVPAEAEVLGARVADRPAAFPLAELDQRASASVVDRDVFSRRLRPPETRRRHGRLQPPLCRGPGNAGPLSRRGRSLDPDRQSDASRGPLRPVCGQTGRSSVSTGAPKIIDFAPPGWPLPTQLSRYQCRLLAAAMGQFDPFPRLELNGRCRTRKRSFAGDD